jgi:hypothetical protein
MFAHRGTSPAIARPPSARLPRSRLSDDGVAAHDDRKRAMEALKPVAIGLLGTLVVNHYDTQFNLFTTTRSGFRTMIRPASYAQKSPE